jgi:hypothetical protein
MPRQEQWGAMLAVHRERQTMDPGPILVSAVIVDRLRRRDRLTQPRKLFRRLLINARAMLKSNDRLACGWATSRAHPPNQDTPVQPAMRSEETILRAANRRDIP